MALVQMDFESEYLKGNTTISIILPDRNPGVNSKEFYQSGKKYKVLWLLHGTFGDHSDWIRKSNIELYACEKDLVVVMPSGLNANYANWPEFSIGYNMYDYFFEELMPMIYNWFPVSENREDNYIAGLSMGGRGTCVYAFNHPEKFTAAAILSAAPSNVDDVKKEDQMFWKRTEGMIKNAGGEEAFKSSYENVWKIITEKANTGELPRLYFCCGKDDFLYSSYQKFKQYSKDINLEATFEEADGYCHEWRFWDLYIQKALDFFGIHNKVSSRSF